MPSYQNLKSVSKTMRVLEQLNTHPVVKLKDLAQRTDIPASTLIRILETLIELGYVRKLARMSGYCITEKVLALSAGYHGLPEILTQAQQKADEITQAWHWPAAIATLDMDAMVVRYSTIPQSPLSHAHSTVNKRLDLLKNAHGRAYLSFCPKEERRWLLSIIAKRARQNSRPADIEKAFSATLLRTRRQGYARRAAHLNPQTSSLAVPLRRGKKLVATLGVTFFKSSLRDPRPLAHELLIASKDLEIG